MIEYAAIIITGTSLATSIGLLIWNRSLRQQAAADREDRIEAERLAEEARDEVDQRVVNLFSAQVSDFKAKFEADNTHLLSQALVGETVKRLTHTIRASVEARFNRVGQEFIGQINDEADGLSRSLQVELCERIWDAFQRLQGAGSGGTSPDALPRRDARSPTPRATAPSSWSSRSRRCAR
jgi:hypothetical protein